MTIQEMYDQSIKPLPPAERFRLATLILNEIPPQAVVDYSDEWSEEDLRDFTNAGLAYINKVLEEEADD
jgi:protoheme ferro-lyase